MSETHTQGRIVARDEWLIPEAQAERPIGGSSDKIKDREHYANIVTTVNGKYHDNRANARRLAACWNAFEGVRTRDVEMAAVLGNAAMARITMEQAAIMRGLLGDILKLHDGDGIYETLWDMTTQTDEYKEYIEKLRAFLKGQP